MSNRKLGYLILFSQGFIGGEEREWVSNIEMLPKTKKSEKVNMQEFALSKT